MLAARDPLLFEHGTCTSSNFPPGFAQACGSIIDIFELIAVQAAIGLYRLKMDPCDQECCRGSAADALQELEGWQPAEALADHMTLIGPETVRK